MLYDIRRDRTSRGSKERLELAAFASLVAERTTGATTKHGSHKTLLAVLLLSLELAVLLLGGWRVAGHVRMGTQRPRCVCR